MPYDDQAAGSIDPLTRLGVVHLTVADLDRQIGFYGHVLGLTLRGRQGVAATLGTARDDLLKLTEDRGARPPRGTTGLYHFALLFPNRRDLARSIARLISLRYPNAPTDHVMTKTTYLSDPEGNGIELYADTPEEGSLRVLNGRPVVHDARGLGRTGRDPLDLKELFQDLDAPDRLEAPAPDGTTMGHIHLHVADLDTAMRFYHGVIGFDQMGVAAEFGMGMLSAGGYHHHIGVNIWAGRGAPPPPRGALGLRYFTVLLPHRTELEQVAQRVARAGIPVEQAEDGLLVRDPSGNGVLLAIPAVVH